MPNKEYDVKDILRLLGSWITEIRLENAISYLDINKVSEGFAMKLLNLLYGYELEDLTRSLKNIRGSTLAILINLKWPSRLLLVSTRQR